MSGDDTGAAGRRARTVQLLPEVDRKLAAYAKLRHTTPEAAAAAAIEMHLREHADVALRLEDARATFEKARRNG